MILILESLLSGRCESGVEENLQAMNQAMNAEQQEFLLDGLLNEEFPSQTSNRFALEGLSSFSITSEVKAARVSS